MQPIEHLTYIERITFVLAADLQDCDEDLIRFYALLALTKGTATTLADVHDAWALWRASSLPEHPAIVPFDDLDPSVQELDRPYMEAIHHAAKEGRSDGQ